jgi:microcystin-dependent protein
MGASTPVWALPYPAETDPADVPVDVKKLADRLEILLSQLKSGGAIPGEVRMWSGSAVPVAGTYGHWVWADGAIYVTATYPLASGNIAAAWKTHNGKPDPGAGNFRVPDLRGSAPIGLDTMPGGTAAGRIVRAAGATLAGVSGEELHTLLLAEIPAHTHPIDGNGSVTAGGSTLRSTDASGSGFPNAGTAKTAGGGGTHENLPPTTFVPYIVKLDD